MSFMKPKMPPPPPVPPPPPITPVPAVAAEDTEESAVKERMRRKKGLSSTILTGPRGLLPEQMPINSPYLLGETGAATGTSAGGGA